MKQKKFPKKMGTDEMREKKALCLKIIFPPLVSFFSSLTSLIAGVRQCETVPVGGFVCLHDDVDIAICKVWDRQLRA